MISNPWRLTLVAGLALYSSLALAILPDEPPAKAKTASQGALAPEMVEIRAGCFEMGSPKGEARRDKDERQHQVCVKDFEIGRYEVTRGQFRVFVESTGYRTDAEKNTKEGCFLFDGKVDKLMSGMSWRDPGYPQQDDHPVACVSVYDAMAYAAWLSRETGQRYRLPTEAEWEYACRGGQGNERYCGGNDPDRLAWYEGNSGSKTHPVGQKQANGYGLYDLSGNVWEWTCSDYDQGYGGAEQRCSSGGAHRASRGGGWSFTPRHLRSAVRSLVAPGSRLDYLGFRLARTY